MNEDELCERRILKAALAETYDDVLSIFIKQEKLEELNAKMDILEAQYKTKKAVNNVVQFPSWRK